MQVKKYCSNLYFQKEDIYSTTRLLVKNKTLDIHPLWTSRVLEFSLYLI